MTLRQPDTGNRVDLELAAEIRAVCQEVRENDGVRVAVLTGSGGCFSVGREPLLPELASGSIAQRLAWLEQLRVADAIAGLPVPVIVSINGDALDHGLEIALAGDLRLAAEEARLGLTDLTRKGSFPWDGGTQRLPRLVGPAWARDLVLTSRIIDAAQARDIGLVSRVVKAAEQEQETRHVAETIAQGGPVAVQYAREAITKGMDLSLAEGLRLEADLNIILQSTADRTEGLRSFAEKRTPRFSGQ
ncbi:MAG TPA: enoyl-CoA hydratase-related protein [Dehalococcoidia bacterium]|nr:enoyl-CoA hydratase-related protein [Dehalococcoidia bacterium]